jgi:hypothetical protein
VRLTRRGLAVFRPAAAAPVPAAREEGGR